MEKQKRWQFWAIAAVMAWTVINIFPTIFYYSQPLKEPINKAQALSIGKQAASRAYALEDDALNWVSSYVKHLGLKPKSIAFTDDNHSSITVKFKLEKEAQIFKSYVAKAGSLIGFAPAQLTLYPYPEAPFNVILERKINHTITSDHAENYFQYVQKKDDQGAYTKEYTALVYDRASHLLKSASAKTQIASLLEASAKKNLNSEEKKQLTLFTAEHLIDASKKYGADHPLTQRILHLSLPNKQSVSLLEKHINEFIPSLKKENDLKNVALLENTKAFLKKHQDLLSKEITPLTQREIDTLLSNSAKKINAKDPRQIIYLLGRNPYIQALVIDWAHDEIDLLFYKDVEHLSQNFLEAKQALIEEISRLSTISQEKFTLNQDTYAVKLFSLTSPHSFLTFSLEKFARDEATAIQKVLDDQWHPQSEDFARENFPIESYETYKSLKGIDRSLGLFVLSPLNENETKLHENFTKTSLFVLGKGLVPLLEKAQAGHKLIEKDIKSLLSLMQSKGFLVYRAEDFGLDKTYHQDIVFQLPDFYAPYLAATREAFETKGSMQQAVLAFTDLEQRINTENRIDDAIQNELIQWEQDYNLAQVNLNEQVRKEVAPPTKNVYLSNLKLSLTKYFRGDGSRVLKWGLDLSGGKTVRIGLLDANGHPVSDQDDLNQAVNELYTRVNKMGVAERTIRIENDHIVLDFPGSQALSAEDLIKASAMYFHIVNEKFSGMTTPHRALTEQFLQSIWNEARITERTSIDEIQQIAWERFGLDPITLEPTEPKDTVAKALYDAGLRLANPLEEKRSHNFNETISTIAKLKGDDYKDWYGASHPLIIVFHNYALEGSNLSDIRVGYDPMQGNTLSFSVASAYETNELSTPREVLYRWTKTFSEENIINGPNADYTNGRGYRMAAILNNEIISMPALGAAIKDGGTISGRFTQKEIGELAADLKAGSLTFTPKVLSEQNVSPELGKEERNQSLLAAACGLLLVAAAMIFYYRFAGFIATCAVFLNLFIMWGILQNLGAALTLPGLAGIVLTIGMAVDANVLVFERIREEFKLTGNIAMAIHAGYEKAFNAIVDANVTTIIAAVILTQFDSGPIKGFAVTLIIGIVSSMFTSLFMTRYFFAGWVQKKENSSLHLMEILSDTNIAFFSKRYIATGISIAIIIVGGIALYQQKEALLGMDFKGGYALQIEVEEPSKEELSPRLLIAAALEKHGVGHKEMEIQELGNKTSLRIQLASSMDEKGHPFFNIAEKNNGLVHYKYQTIPRLNWIIDTLQSENIHIKESSLSTLENHWTMMSGRFSDVMRNNALIALSLALFAILVYITFRFEFIYAISSVIALGHDVLVTLGLLGILKSIGVPIQIDLEIVGALMTIIGYSLNDTIIVFDRIREDIPLMQKVSFRTIIDHALNQTLGRTIMTSLTTLLVLIPLVFFGGASIFAFSLVMTLGVIVGTLSTLFIAGPLLNFFHNKERSATKSSAVLKNV